MKNTKTLNKSRGLDHETVCSCHCQMLIGSKVVFWKDGFSCGYNLINPNHSEIFHKLQALFQHIHKVWQQEKDQVKINLLQDKLDTSFPESTVRQHLYKLFIDLETGRHYHTGTQCLFMFQGHTHILKTSKDNFNVLQPFSFIS